MLRMEKNRLAVQLEQSEWRAAGDEGGERKAKVGGPVGPR